MLTAFPFGLNCLWRGITMADWTCYSSHSFGATNCYWLISEKDRCQRAQSPSSQRSSHLSKSAFPDHCDEGIFQDGLSVGLSLWDLHLWRLFHSLLRLQPFFFGGPECRVSLSWSWEMPSVVGSSQSSSIVHTDKSQAATSDCLLMGQKSEW